MRPLAVLLALVSALVATAGAESPEQELWSPYWSITDGFKSSLQMKNNLAAEPLQVEVSVYLAEGGEYRLGVYTLQPRETTTLDLNRAIEAAAPTGTMRQGWGNLEVKFESTDPSALMGSISVVNPDAGIAWDFRLYSVYPELAGRPLRGVFWLPNQDADGFIAIQNVNETATIVSPKLIVDGASLQLPPFELAPESGRRLYLRKYLEDAGIKKAVAGGIELSSSGAGSPLIAHGVLFDMRGFSAEIDMRPQLGNGERKVYALRTPRAAIGPADPALGLGRDVSFTPMLILHNFSAAPVATDLLVANSGNASPAQRGARYSLAGGATKLINLATFFPSPASNWISAEIRSESTTNYIGAELISVSNDGSHTLRSVMNHVGGAIREGWYWRVGDSHDTLLAIFNPENASATAKVSLDFKTGSAMDRYDLGRRVIPAHGTAIIDIGALAASGVPDSSGKVLPKNTEGGYSVEGVPSPRRGNLMTEALVFDRKQKTFETYYNTCCRTTASHTPTSLSGAVGGTGQMFVSERNACTGVTTDVTGAAGYSSFNSSIASANPGGRANYNAAGSTTLRSTWEETHWINVDQSCYDVVSNGDRPTNVLKLQVQGNNFVFVGTDPAFASVNKYFATVAQPPGGVFSATSSNSGDTFTSGSTSGIAWISVKTTAQSNTNSDRGLTFKYASSSGSSTTQQKSVTARQFAYATNGPLSNVCTRNGYDYTIVYTPYTHPDKSAAEPGIGLDGTAVTETFNPSTFSCNVTTGNGTLDQNSQFSDHIASCFATPPPACSSSHTQTLRVGGYAVRTNSLIIKNTSMTYTNQGPTQ